MFNFEQLPYIVQILLFLILFALLVKTVLWGLSLFDIVPVMPAAPAVPDVLAVPAVPYNPTLLATNIPFAGAGNSPGNNVTNHFMCSSIENDYIDQIKINAGADIDSIQFRCHFPDSNNQPVLSPVYGGGGGASITPLNGPFNTLTGKAGSWISNINGFGGSNGSNWNMTCPSGKIVGMDVTSGNYVSKLQPYCV